jgi:pantetheine-phosphate adenylyltransferase
MASPEVSFVSSSGIKEIATYGGKIDGLVPKAVAKRLYEMFGSGRPGAPVPPSE